MKQPIIKSNKQHIRLWFEFLKMCHRDPDFDSNLRSSAEFYKPWGNVTTLLFDEWWKDHKSLFGSTRVEPINRVVSQPNALNVSIPLNQPVSKSIKEIKELIESKQTERLDELGLNLQGKKSKAVSFGKYEVDAGVEIRGKTLYEIQLMYSIWLDLGKPPINTAYCLEVVERLRSRPRAKWIPYLLQQDPSEDRKGNLRYSDDQLRQVRRYIKRGQKVCESVSKGRFPGKNSLKG